MVPAVLAFGASAQAAQAAEYDGRWAFAGIGSSQRVVQVISIGGGCDTPLAPVVVETRAAVRITTRYADGDPDCVAAQEDHSPVFVTLTAPLRGRSLLGAGPTFPRTVEPDPRAPAPRVVGLSPGDAVTALKAEGVTPVVVRRRGGTGLRRVVAQNGARIVFRGVSP